MVLIHNRLYNVQCTYVTVKVHLQWQNTRLNYFQQFCQQFVHRALFLLNYRKIVHMLRNNQQFVNQAHWLMFQSVFKLDR